MKDIFFAAIDRTSKTMEWATLYMALNQDVQAKVHEEIDRVINQDELYVTYQDKPK